MTSKRPIRWWPAVVLAVLAAAVLAFLWLRESHDDQQRTVGTLVTVQLTVILLFLWLVLFSRLPGRRRLVLFVAGVLAIAALRLMVRVEGVTGNFLPIVYWRWSAPPPQALESPLESAFGAAPAVGVLSDDDYPQLYGPHRDATLHGRRLARDWTARPPRELWRIPVGEAWSSFAIAGDAAVTLEQRGGEETVVRYDLATGQVVWTHGFPVRFAETIAGVGPRSTPTIHDDGRVYTLGATGILSAFDLATGELVWSHDVLAEHGVPVPRWGKACSPLVLGEKVIVSVGGHDGWSLAAFHKDTGEVFWHGGDDGSSYSSPVFATLAGAPQIVILNHTSVAGHDPGDGRVLWTTPWPGGQPNVSMPILLGDDRLLVSKGYGYGSTAYRIARSADGAFTVETLWHSPRLKSKFADMVEYRGSVYGLDDGVLACIDPETGDRRWKKGRYGHGQLILVDDLLLIQAENGDLVLAEANPERPVELARIPALSAKTWNPPALAGHRLLVRNHREAVCYELESAG